MKRIFVRAFNVWMVFVLAFGMFSSGVPVTAQTTPPSPVEILASARGLQSKDLVLQDATTFTLLDGRQVQRIKALDSKTGQQLGGDFENGVEVNLAALQAEAGKAWRGAHGALTPLTLEQLSALAPGDTVNISVWLAGDIQSLAHDEFKPGAAADSSSAGVLPAGGQSSIPPTVNLGGKDVTIPLAQAQIPDFVRAATMPGGQSQLPAQRSAAEQAAGMKAQAEAIPAADGNGQIEAFKQTNQRYLEAQVAPLQAAFASRLAQNGLKAAYASAVVPSAYLENVSRATIEKMAFWPEIDAIYIVPEHAGPALDNARPAQNATEVNNAGYNGLGVTVAVLEGERAFFANPALVLNAAYDGLQPYTNHPTAVCGFIKSTAAGFEGLANGATVDSANGSYSNWGTMTAAMDWATTNDTVINNSWYWDSGNSAVFWEADRRLDYYVRHNYDFVSVAAGNFGNGCGTNFSTYVVSPAKGYNVLSVGNYEDQDNIGWSDDAMDYCSSFGNPGSDSATPTRDKPEVSAIGATMDSTLPSAVAPLTGPVGSGTSYSSPMVAALAADLIQAQPTLADKPESLRAIIMATALHNVEGGAVNSDKDGTGGVDFTAALATAEREQFTSQYVESTTAYPLTFYLTAHQGERVRYVATWLSNPNAAYTTDVLPADLELYAYRADGSTYITSSTSSVNNYEIVEFIAPATETYVFKVFKFSFSGSLTWLGTAGWRGEYRISPLIYYSDPVASPLGTHLAIYPADWTHSNYWRVLGLRSVNSDHDLRLNSASLFDDPSSRSYLAGSSSGASIDMVVVDGNHRSSALSEHYLVSKFSGPGGYDVDWSNNNGVLLSGTSGPFTRGSALPADIHDLYLDPGLWRILIVPNGLSNTSNLSAYLFASSSIDTYSWTQGAYSAAAHSDVSTSTLTTEGFFYNAPAADYYGLVISGVSAGSSSYYVKVERVVFLPAVMR